MRAKDVRNSQSLDIGSAFADVSIFSAKSHQASGGCEVGCTEKYTAAEKFAKARVTSRACGSLNANSVLTRQAANAV